MARATQTQLTNFKILTILFSLFTISATGDNYSTVKPIDQAKLGLKKEKLTQFKLYWHDVVSGPKPSLARIIKPVNGSTTGFGSVMMINDPLTDRPELSSKLIGRAQGFYASASQEETSLLMAMNFAFSEGKYNGSTITILGRNTVSLKVREMPVMGGSGLFRSARGYVEARTYSYDPKKGDAGVEYNVRNLLQF